MNAERFERMCQKIMEDYRLSEEAKIEIIRIYAAEYRAYAERTRW